MDRDINGCFIKGHKNFKKRNVSKCSVEGCNTVQGALGFCFKHYQRFKKYGDPNKTFTAWGKHLKNGRNLVCPICLKGFYKPKSQINKIVNFCSRKCAFIGMKGRFKKIRPIYKKKWYLNTKGYEMVTVRRKKIFKHRFLLEKKLKRDLTPDEVVHHINGIKSDNRLSNLVVVSKADHMRSHKSIYRELLLLRKRLAVYEN